MPRILKPLRLSTLHRVLTLNGKPYLVVVTLAAVPFDLGARIIPEAALWKLVGDALGATPLDECLPKSRAEVLVSGFCFPPGGSHTASYCRMRAGDLDKTVAVVGERFWNDGVPSAPQPFASMPMTWDRAFGGSGFSANLIGRGLDMVDGVRPLANLELPASLVTSPHQRPVPAGFMPIDASWSPRAERLGTYDGRWLRESFPGYASDLDPAFFNAAPADQQRAHAFAGGESFAFENMHPTKPLVEGIIPRFAARTLLQRVGVPDWEEVTMRLDTLWFFPHVERALLVFRGVVPLVEDDASDIETILLAAEDAEAPRPASHYVAEAAARLDKERGALRSLRDAPLLPKLDVRGPPLPEDASPMKELLQTEGIAQKRGQARLQRELAGAREKVAAALTREGIDPSSRLSPTPTIEPLPSVDDEEAVLDRLEREEVAAETARIEAEDQKLEMERSVRKTCEDLGLDYDALKAEGQRNAAGPPKFRAKVEWERIRKAAEELRTSSRPALELEAKLADPKFFDNLVAQEQAMIRMYRQGAHLAPAAPRRAGDEGNGLRQTMHEAHAMKLPLGADDWTGVDLSNLDLRGADLRGAFLESTDLRNADLRGANLTDAVLAHADLRGANLEACQLVGANLGSTQLEGARFNGAIASKVILMRANATRATFRGAHLDDVDFMETLLEGADLSDAALPGVTFMKTSLRDVRFTSAKMHRGSFIEIDATGADFSGADLSLVSFVNVKAEACSFRGANLTKFHAVKECSLAGAIFDGANLSGAFMRGTALSRSSFREANLADADLGSCDLRQASFYRARAQRAGFERADLANADLTGMNLMEGSLQNAKVFGAKLVGMNLFRADLAKLRVDTATVLAECLMTHARIYPKATDAAQ